MKLVHCALYILLILAPLAVNYLQAAPAVSKIDEQLLQKMARDAFEYTNEFRVKQGLRKVSWNQQLADYAYVHSYDMATHRLLFGHYGFENRIGDMASLVHSFAENLYKDNGRGNRARAAVDGWIKSPGHHRNLVGDFTHCGIAVCRGYDGYWYFTQIFAKM